MVTTDFRTVVLRAGGYNAHSRCKSVEGCGLGGKGGLKLQTEAEFREASQLITGSRDRGH